MKAFFASILLLFGSLFGSEQSLFTSDLKALLKVLEVPNDGTPQSIIDATQKAWKRPAGKELWNVVDTLTPVQRQAVLDYCMKVGYFDEHKPLYQDYDYAVVLGATTSRIEKRMAYLAKMVDEGIRFKKVILLSGARPLDPAVESIPEGCKTEGEVMEYLWKSNPLSQKIAWKHYVCPMIKTDTGTRRPITADTLGLWLSHDPRPGRCLMFSNQPYCLLQQLITQHAMPKEFACETVGSVPSLKSINAQALLDTISRCLYETHQR